MTVLLVLRLYQAPFLDLLTTEEIGQEVVRTLATSIALVLAVPLTTAIAVATLPPGREPASAAGRRPTTRAAPPPWSAHG